MFVATWLILNGHTRGAGVLSMADIGMRKQRRGEKPHGALRRAVRRSVI
jgi:hypothetical protein